MQFRRSAIILLAAAFSVGASWDQANSAVPAAGAALPANAEAHIATAPPPFMTWAIVTDQGVRTGHRGVNETTASSTDEVMFHVASIAKTVVAASVMRLVQQRKLKLTSKVSDILPNIKVADPRWKLLTVEHLVSNTSGLKDYADNGYQQPVRSWAGAFAHLSAPEAIAFTGDPGSEFSYTNRNFDLLALIIGAVSGANFSDFARREILAPNGAPNARLSCYDVPSSKLAPGYGASVSGQKTRNFYKPFSKARAGAGGLCISSKELAVWANTIFDCKRPGATLSCASISEMKRTRKGPYGLGLFMDKLGTIETIGHNGGDVGYAAALVLAPEAGVAVAVATNFVLAQPEYVAEMILAQELGFPYPKSSKLRPLEEYEGLYFSEKRGTCVRVSEDAGQLFIEYQDVDYPYAVSRFRIPPIATAGIFQGPFPGGKLAHILEDKGTIAVQLWYEYPSRKTDRFKRSSAPATDCSGWF